jgi:tRNA threonylcarbamoyladenosine biosynthesis protein TsaE
VALLGNLGAGKTTFVRYFAEAAGSTVPVSSPTYVLMHEYPLANGQLVEHWDLYRLGMAPAELEEPPAPGMIRFIEWPERDAADVLIFDYALRLTIPAEASGRQLSLFSGPLRTSQLLEA